MRLALSFVAAFWAICGSASAQETMLSAFRTTCGSSAAANDLQSVAVGQGWQPVAKDAHPMLKAEADRMEALSDVERISSQNYERSLDGQRVFLRIEETSFAGQRVTGCGIEAFEDVWRAPSEIIKWVGPPTRHKNEVGRADIAFWDDISVASARATVAYSSMGQGFCPSRTIECPVGTKALTRYLTSQPIS